MCYDHHGGKYTTFFDGSLCLCEIREGVLAISKMAMKTAFKRKSCCSKYPKALQCTAMVVDKWEVLGQTCQQ